MLRLRPTPENCASASNSVGCGVNVGDAEGIVLKVGDGDIVGANDQGDSVHNELVSLRSKQSHRGGDDE